MTIAVDLDQREQGPPAPGQVSTRHYEIVKCFSMRFASTLVVLPDLAVLPEGLRLVLPKRSVFCAVDILRQGLLRYSERGWVIPYQLFCALLYLR